MNTTAQTFRVVGRRVPKVDAIDKVTGRAQYGADILLPRKLVGKVLRSPTPTPALPVSIRARPKPCRCYGRHHRQRPPHYPGVAGPTGQVTMHDAYLSQKF